jgi:hypothetical protein
MSTFISKGVASTLAALPSSTLSANITSSQTFIPVTSTTNFSSYTGAIITSTNEVVSYTETTENYQKYSTDLSTGYGANVLTKTLNATTAPDGTNTGTLLTSTSSPAQDSYLRYSITLTPGTQYTTSVYAKAGTVSFIALRSIQNGTNDYSTFNLGTGAVAGAVPAGVTTSVLNAGNGWYRCSITYTTQSPTITNGFEDLSISKGLQSYPTLGLGVSSGDSIFVWGIQTNLGSTAKTFIPTAASVPVYALGGVTRGASSTTAASATSGATITTTNTINRAHFVNCVSTAGATTIGVKDITNTTLGELYLHNSGDSITIEKSPDDTILLVGGAAKVSAVGSPRS